jgi:WD40 repeat protein
MEIDTVEIATKEKPLRLNELVIVLILRIFFSRDCGKAVAYHSPSLVTGSDNGVVKFWNLETGKCLQTSTGNAPRLMYIVSNPHNRVVASSQDDGTIRLWDLREPLVPGTLPPNRVYRGHQGMATALAFSPNGRLLASTGSDRVVKIWDTKTGNNIQSLTGHTDYVVKLLFIDDRTLLSQSYDTTLRQWDLTTGESEMLNYLDRQWCIVFALSPDGDRLLFGSDKSILTVLDRQTNSISSYAAVGSRVRTLIYTRDARFIIAITDDRHLNLWDTQHHYRHCSWSIGDREAITILPHPIQPQLLLIASEDGYISTWDLHQQICLNRVIAHNREICSLVTIHHPDRLVSCGIDGSIKVWEFSGNTLVEIYAIEFEKPYQDMEISGIQGLNLSQITTLTQLGAIA